MDCAAVAAERRRGLRRLLPGFAALGLAGCQAGYYAHLVRGHHDLLARREPIGELLASPGTDAALKERLARALEAREFASRVLGLPDNGSYREYVDLGRPYVLWNVFAAPEFSLAAHEWCYPLVGCLAYRGYYDEARARAEAEALRRRGLETFVAGVAAYSTLGWFDDPLTSTIAGGEDVVAGTIFHELAHQALFVKGDTSFSESFATFVEREGLRHYLADRPELALAAARRRARRDQFIELILGARRRLEAVYASGLPEAAMRERKQAEFEALHADYERLRQNWGSDDFGALMTGEPSNARLLPFGLYHEWVASFVALFAEVDGDWARFHREAGRLAELEPEPRRRRLEELRRPAEIAETEARR